MAWIRPISAVGAILCVLSAPAQEISARQYIDRLVDLAIERNRDLLATRERVQEAQALLRQAGVRPAPTLEVEGATGRPLGTKGEEEYSAGYFYPIETFGKREKRLQVAQQAVALAEAEYQERLRSLKLEIRTREIDAIEEREKLAALGRISQVNQDAYRPLLRNALRHPLLTAGIAAVVFVGSLAFVPFLGAEFIPTLDEGSILVMMYRVPGISMEESLHGNEIIENVLREFPEVEKVVCRTGRPEVATDPMAIDQSDVYVTLKPPSQWPQMRTKEDLIAAMKERLESHAPGAAYSFSQPIQMRMQELTEAGVRSDIAVKIYGADLGMLKEKGDQIASVISKIPGAADVRPERVAGLPYLRIRIRREAIARHGLDASDVLDTIEAIGGKVAGQVVEQNKRFSLQVRFEPGQRSTIDAIRNLKVGDSDGHFIPLAQLADIEDIQGPAQISRENTQRRISVEINVRGRDIASFVKEAQQAVSSKITLPEGYSFEWGGQFQQLESASRRLAIAVPLALLLIFALLYFAFQDVMPTMLIFLNIPLAATGGILALVSRGMPFSISAGVGFIALFGIAVLNGIVLLTYVSELSRSGISIRDAVEQGASIRLRPVVMTALVAGLGFLPMALSHGAGAEVQRPLATVVIGGLVTSTLLTLLVLPSLYLWLGSRVRRQMPARLGRPDGG